MGYLARDDAVKKRTDPRRVTPGAVSAIVAALNYDPGLGEYLPSFFFFCVFFFVLFIPFTAVSLNTFPLSLKCFLRHFVYFCSGTYCIFFPPSRLAKMQIMILHLSFLIAFV